MKSIFNYVEASKHLKILEKAIEQMGGEDEADFMLLAQRDITRLEKQFYRQASIDFCKKVGYTLAYAGLTYIFAKSIHLI